MDKTLNFKEKYLIFVKHYKKKTDVHVLITLVLVILAIMYYLNLQ